MKLTTERLKKLIKEEIEKLDENPFAEETRAMQPGDYDGEGILGSTRSQQSANQSGKIEDRVEKLEQVVNQLIAAIKKNNS